MPLKEAPRTRQLRRVLTTHKSVRDKNHTITLHRDVWGGLWTGSHIPGFPQWDRCQGCPLFLACQSLNRPQAKLNELANSKCLQQVSYLSFEYHGTCCLAYCLDTGHVNNFGTFSWSPTTNRAIKWYVQALVSVGLIADSKQLDVMKYIYAHGIGSLNPGTPWFPTR